MTAINKNIGNNSLLGLLLTKNNLVRMEKVINISDKTVSQNHAVQNICGSTLKIKIDGMINANQKIYIIISQNTE